MDKHRNNNLEILRLRAGLTRQQVANRLGTTETTIYRKERADRSLKDNEIPAYAKAYECHESEIIGSKIPSQVKITHFIGDKGQLFEFPEEQKKPINLSFSISKKVNAALVKDNYMFPVFREGQVIFYTKEPIQKIPSIKKHAQVNYNQPTGSSKYAEFFGKPCLVELSDGSILLRELKPGSERLRYTIRSYSSPDMENVEIRAAYKIVFIKADFADNF